MPPIVGQDGDAMMQCGGPNQKVEVANCFALGSEPAAFATKHSRDRVVDTHQLDAAEKSLKSFLAALRVAGIEHALIQLGERDER
jgi:hypothetical protein